MELLKIAKRLFLQNKPPKIVPIILVENSRLSVVSKNEIEDVQGLNGGASFVKYVQCSALVDKGLTVKWKALLIFQWLNTVLWVFTVVHCAAKPFSHGTETLIIPLLIEPSGQHHIFVEDIWYNNYSNAHSTSIQPLHYFGFQERTGRNCSCQCHGGRRSTSHLAAILILVLKVAEHAEMQRLGLI